MRIVLLVLALAGFSARAHAESNACANWIDALPWHFVAGAGPTPGKWCLRKNMTFNGVVGDEIGIFIDGVEDFELDCNGYRLTGTRVTPENKVAFDQFTAIYVGSSMRVKVHDCQVSGFSYGIQVHRSGNGLPRSRDVEIYDNRIEGSQTGILAFPEGDSRIHDNIISNALAYGFWIDVPVGQLRVSNNAVLSTGDSTSWVGQGANLRSDLGGWLIFEGNTITETASPPGTAGAPVVDMPAPAGGVGIAFTGNKIWAPANNGRKGSVTTAVNNPTGTLCMNNLIIGYGTLPADCADPTNLAY